MARNASGTYSTPAGQPVVAGTTITAAAHNDLVNDIVTEITDSLSRSGKGGMLAVLKAVDGAVGGPAFSFNSEATSGIYRAGAGDLRLAILGALVAKFVATGLDITGKLTTTGNVEATGTVLAGGVDLGTTIGGHARLAAPYTNATNGLTNVTGLSFAVAANADYEFEAELFESTTDGTKGSQFGFTGPAAPTAVHATRICVLPTQAVFVATMASFAGTMLTSTLLATIHSTRISGFLRNGANAGTLQLQAACVDAGATLTVAAGSWLSYRKVA